ncbi:acyl carrier protein [Jatrophihabitans lederbergiae]|uniref:Acyl carrier protein n=1 Tax=Jatrophihabitans lederbergiae TaxID=3075547 RepID=A0ABU2JGU3_9ACTN|nr:acyl carrier protein [Jatrophihabitans sp. DSM 44399]MDT0263453.1 acyl carrier protein [Jatrophihabitans sp. DSM 44399]
MEPAFVELLRSHLKYAGDQPISHTSRLRDMGLDSMRSIELLFDVEDSYRITISDERLSGPTFETAGALWEVVAELRAGDGDVASR